MICIAPSRTDPLRRCVFLLVPACAFLAALSVRAAKPDKTERQEMKREAGSAPTGKSGAEDAQSRAMAKVREQLAVNDDAEWAVIAERITRVVELRRNLPGS